MLCEFHLNSRKIHRGPQGCRAGTCGYPHTCVCTHRDFFEIQRGAAHGRNTLPLQGVLGRNTQAINSSGPTVITVTRFRVVEHSVPSSVHVSYPSLCLFCITLFISSPPAPAWLRHSCTTAGSTELSSRLIIESPRHVTLALFHFAAQSLLLLLSHQPNHPTESSP